MRCLGTGSLLSSDSPKVSGTQSNKPCSKAMFVNLSFSFDIFPNRPPPYAWNLFNNLLYIVSVLYPYLCSIHDKKKRFLSLGSNFCPGRSDISLHWECLVYRVTTESRYPVHCLPLLLLPALTKRKLAVAYGHRPAVQPEIHLHNRICHWSSNSMKFTLDALTHSSSKYLKIFPSQQFVHGVINFG